MNWPKHTKMILAGVAVLCCTAGAMTAQGPGRGPNIVLIFADDLGYGDVGCYGAAKVKTPNIDRLAKEGRLFTDAHSASAVCTPSRYALLTGRYPFRKKDLWAPVFLRTPLVIATDRLTLGSLMKQAGYATACIGKWHLGFGRTAPTDWNKPLKPGPLELGFETYFGVPVVNSHPPFVYVEDHAVVGLDPADPLAYGKRAATAAYPEKMGLGTFGGAAAAHALYKDEEVATTLTRRALDWIRERKDGRFFLYLATTNIHHPFTPRQEFRGTSKAGRYGDFIHELDWVVGQVLDTLDTLQLAEKTLVVFTSDNGGMLNQGGQDAWKAGHRLNGELLGFKFDAWEGGHRVPFIARWPGRIPAGTRSDQLICNVDLLATFAAVAGRELKADEGPDSFDMLPALTGSPAQPIRDHLVLAPRSAKHIALREGKWVYIGARGAGGFTARRIGEHGLGGPAAHRLTHQVNSDIKDCKLRPDAPAAQLYDLKADLSQARNVIREHPERAASMKARLAEIQGSRSTRPAAAGTGAKRSSSGDLLGALGQLTQQLFYYPDNRVHASPDVLGVKWEDVEFHSADGTRLHGWFLRPDDQAKGTVIHCHGNAANVSAHTELVAWLPRHGYNVLMFDYRGFGRSAGEVDRAGIQADAAAAVAYAASRADVAADRILLMGHSIGGAIALRGVGDGSIKGIRGVVTEGAFSSYRRVAGDKDGGTGLAALLVNDALSPLPVMHGIAPVPLLIVHADKDEVVPLHHARALHKAAKDPRELWIVKDGRHMDTFVSHGDEPRHKLLKFFDRCLRTP